MARRSGKREFGDWPAATARYMGFLNHAVGQDTAGRLCAVMN